MPGSNPVIDISQCPPAAPVSDPNGCGRATPVFVCNAADIGGGNGTPTNGSTEATQALILAELQKPRYDIEFSMCNDGADDYMLIVDKNELVAGIPTVTYRNMTTNASSAVRPVGLKCASQQVAPCVPVAPVGVIDFWS